MKGIKLFRIFGIDIILDLTALIFIFLIIWSFYIALNKQFNDQFIGIIGAIIMAFMVYFSLICHELSHSLVGRRFGFIVRKIRIFIFGGAAEMERGDWTNAKAEFWMAIAGPIMSFVLGFVFFALTAIFKLFDFNLLAFISGQLCWLNFLLAIFNLIPCLPMDGGRVLRSALNYCLKNFIKATKIAGGVANAITLLVIAGGILACVFINMGFLWYVLIAWFIRSAGKQECRYFIAKYSNAKDLMRKINDSEEKEYQELVDSFSLQESLYFCCHPYDSGEKILEKLKANIYLGVPIVIVIDDSRRVAGIIIAKDVGF